MVFLSPLALFALAVALVPPLLHLFQRSRPAEVVFPAVRYLRQTEREAERAIRLRHLLLLLLRVLAVVLLVLAAARPVVPAGLGALHEPTAVAVVLDNSLSSGAMTGGRRVLDDLAARARETLRAAQAGDALWLIGADGLARRGTPRELLELAGALLPDARRLDLGAAVRQAARLVAGAGYARAEVHVLSDLQASAFDAVVDSAAAGLAVLFYHPAAPPPENRGVVAARPRPSVWVVGSGAVTVGIGGTGGGAGARPGAGSLVLEGRSGARALGGPGDEVALAAPRAESGWRRGEVELEADELRADDRRPFAVRVVAPAGVTLEPAADLGPFLREAVAVLTEGGQVHAGLDVRVGHAPAARAGAAVVFPPADPLAVGAVNRALAAAGLRWRFGGRVEREDTLASGEIPELAGARVRVRYRLEPLAGDTARGVLVRAGGAPWLVRDRWTVLVGSRMVPEETPLPLTGGFVPFVGALVNRVARGEAGILEAAPGASIAVPERVSGIVTAGDSVRRVEPGAVIAAPDLPGAYPLLAGADTVAMLVVAADPRESDLTRAAAAALHARYPGAHVKITTDPRVYAALRFRGAGRSELTGWLLAAALLVLLVEPALAAGRLRAKR
jgi:hypothetical protein